MVAQNHTNSMRNTWNSNHLEQYKNIWFQLFVIAMLLVIGGVEMNPGPNLPNVHSQNDGYHYMKTTGCANMKGELYEVKLAALLFARELIKEQDFFLASNMAAAGAFDDVVLKHNHQAVFIQLKHRENKKMEIGKQQLTSRQGNFSLLRYYNSFCEIEQQWFKNKDLQHYGRFEDALFIVYTNATLKRDLGNQVQNSEWQNVLSSGGKCICFTEDFCSSDEVDSLKFKKFLSQHWFFTEQAAENQLDDLIKNELLILYGTDSVYAQFLSGVENWWKDSDIYLSKKVLFMQDIFQSLAAHISKQKLEEIKHINISFNGNQYILIRTFLIYAQVLHIFPKGTGNCVILSCLKIHESLKTQCHMIIDVNHLETHLSEVLALWKRWCDVLVIVGHKITNEDDMMAILQKYPCKRLVLIGGTTVRNKIQCKKVTYFDNVILRQLSKVSQAQILTTLVNFQGYNTPLGAIIENKEAIQDSIPSDVIVSLLTRELKLGSILTVDLDYYIPRTLRISGQERNVYSNVDSVLDVPHRVVLVSAEPGMGKSTLLTHLVLGTKQTQPAMWVIRVNLNDFTQKLNRLPENLQLKHAFEFLLDASGAEAEWKEMFIFKLKSMKHVCILFDGYDDISPTHADKVSLILKCIQETEIQHLWVTTRPVMRNKLEQELSVKTLTLEPLSGEDQRNFLFKFWKRSIPHIEESFLNKFISDLLQLTAANLNDRDREFMGIPLQSLLIAEAFKKNLRIFSETNQLMLPNRFNLLELYISFVNRKLDIYYEKNGIDLTKPGISYDYIQAKERFLQNHMISALIVILPDHELQFIGKMKGIRKFKSLFTSFTLSKNKIQDPMNIKSSVKNILTDFQEGREQTGIIQQIVNDKPEFIHRTFAEYFAALWFSRNFKTITDYLKEKVFDQNFQIVRNFFDRILAQNFDLHDAVLTQNKELVVSLLSERPQNINMRDEGGRTALHLAVMNFTDKLDDVSSNSIDDISSNSMHEIILILLDYGADPRIKDSILGWRPLRLADRIRAWIVIDLLLGEKPVKKDLVLTKRSVHDNIGNGTSLHIAAKYGHLRLVKFLLENNSDIDAAEYEFGKTPLIWAAEIGHQPVVEYLIKNGATKEACDKDGSTALLAAAQSGHFEVFKLLLQHDTNMMASNCDGNTVLHCSVKSGNLELTRFIADRLKSYIRPNCCNNKNQTPLWFAAQSSFLHITELLCQHNIDLNVQDSELGWTPLHAAASEGHLQVVEYLIQHGATINACDEEGNTPLLLSAWRGHFEVFKLLSQQDSVTAYNKNGNTVLHCAAWSGNTELVTYILDILLVDVDCCNLKLRTPMWFSTLSDLSETTELLIKRGAKINIQDSELGWSPLHAAVSECDLQIVQNLVQLGTELNVSDKNGCKPLHIAARESRLQVVEYLIQQGCSVSECDYNGNTPVLIAAYYGRLEVFKLLLENYRHVQLYKNEEKACINYVGDTVLHCAASTGNVELVRYVLDSVYLKINYCNEKEQTPLWYACWSGHLQITQLLCEDGANICQQDKVWGYTPLHVATRQGHLHIVHYLIEKGAKVNVRDNEGNTALLTAADCGEFEIFKFLSQSDYDITVCNSHGDNILHCAAWSGNTKLIRYILLDSQTFAVNCYTYEHQTPLWFAARSGQFEAVKFLCERGADIYVQDIILGWSPLHIAAYEGHLHVVDYLIRQGSTVNACDQENNTALILSAWKGHLDIFKLLSEHDTNMTICNRDGNNILHCTAWSGNIDLTKYILETLPLDVNCCNIKHRSPLWFAAEKGHLQIVELLYECGADLNVQDTIRKWTPLHAATYGGHQHVVEYLILHGAMVSACDIGGHTALRLAAYKGYLEAFKLLSQHETDITTSSINGNNILHYAAWSGNAELTKYILDTVALNIDCYNKLHQTPLWLAAYYGKLETTRLLCDCGAILDIKDFRFGWNPLEAASTKNHKDVVECLTQYGGNFEKVYEEIGVNFEEVSEEVDSLYHA